MYGIIPIVKRYHGYGSKHLIETLHAFGICASYTEVRQFLTSTANHEIAKTEVSYIPYGISPKTLGGDFRRPKFANS
jgi:hypothetical protein